MEYFSTTIMSEDNYSIKEMIADFREENNRRFDEVDAAQAHTNGDVSNLKIWRGYLTGATAVIVVLVIPLIVYVWNQSQDKVTAQTLSAYSQLYGTTNN